MKLKLLSAAALASVCALESTAWGQTSAPEATATLPVQPVAEASSPSQPIAAAETTTAESCCKVPALTPVEFEILTPASSKTSHQGEEIRIRVIEPVMIGGRIVVPAGTEGIAQVIQASHGAFGGKAGELVIGAPYLMLGTQRLDLKRFAYGPSSGRDRFGQAIVATALVGIAGMLISGGNVGIQSGARANAVVTRDTFIPVQTQISTKE